ncbi:MAG: response regulator [Bacteroidota bacterium]
MEKFNILYVDDEQSNLQGFKSIYFKEHHVHTATSAKEAMEILAENEIHILITDQKMPQMSGVEFLNKVAVKYPDPIRIILTGFSDIEVIINAVNNIGIFRYMTKPWNVDEMSKIIDQGLETYRLRLENKRLLLDLKTANDGLEEKVRLRTEQVSKQKDDLQTKRQEVQKQAKKLKALNKTLKQLNESLETKVSDRTSELEVRNVELKMKNKILEEYAFVNAHKLRSPVATVLGLVMLFENVNVTEKERAEIVSKIKAQVVHLNEVTKEIRRNLEKNIGIVPEHTVTAEQIQLRNQS